MNEQMEFPETFEKFAKEYGFKDNKEVYTNGIDLIPVFRVKQWLEHDNKLRTIETDTAYECGKLANKWIPVSERLPEVRYDKLGNNISSTVIIWCERDSSICGKYGWYDFGYFNPRIQCFERISEEGYFETVCHISKVKAWMPLPEPPKGEKLNEWMDID